MSYLILKQVPISAKLLEEGGPVSVLLVDIGVTPNVKDSVWMFISQTFYAVIKFSKLFNKLCVLACCW